MIFQESETVELKAIVTEDIKKTIVAFANCAGGKLYIGVNDDGTIAGLANPDSASLQISNMVRDAVKPDLTMFLHYETITQNGKQIITIDVQRGTERPYYIAKKGLRPEGVYVRQDYSSVPATDTLIRRMIKETDGDSFEAMRSLEQNLTFEAAAKEFLSRDVKLGQSQMKTLGIINQDDIYTNLGLLLSDQCVHTIKAAAFDGTTQSAFQDRKEFAGSLFKQMVDVYNYIDLRNRTRSTFDKLYRIDTRDYPEIAVREALLNLLVHRDYSFSASAFISIYSNRIEFTSIGGLVNGVTLNDVMLGLSVCRNAKLANIFYRLELIEAYGTGLRKIMNSYADSDLTPQIEVSDNAFKIILPNRNFVEEKKISIKPQLEKNHHEETIIECINEKGMVTRKDIEKLLGISQTASGRLLRSMVEKKLIVQNGKGKNTCYIIAE